MGELYSGNWSNLIIDGGDVDIQIKELRALNTSILELTGNGVSAINIDGTTDYARADGVRFTQSVVDTPGGSDTLVLVPEPVTMAILALGGLGMFFHRRRS